MPTDVVMPQMGESITEGTLTKWLKKVGDTVQRDEPLFEISTDKVDAEIPSPAAGTLTEIKSPRARPCRSTPWSRSSAMAQAVRLAACDSSRLRKRNRGTQ
jgi:predicted deacylase